MKSSQKRCIFSLLHSIALLVSIATGVAFSHFPANAIETATPEARKENYYTALEKIPSIGKCPQPLMDWVRDDKSTKLFFVMPLKSELASSCQYALQTNKNRDVNELKKTYQEIFADRFKDVSSTAIKNCPLPNNEDGVLNTSKYFTGLRRIDESLSRIIDESAAINATLPNTEFDESFCDNTFKTHDPKCKAYKKACQKSTEANFDKLAKDATAAADKVFCISFVDKNCQYAGGGDGIVRKLNANTSPQLRQCLSILNKEAPKVFDRPDVLQKTFCNSKNNKEAINQTVATYPFMFGDEFRKTINPYANVSPIVDKADRIQGYDISGPSSGRFPFDSAQVKKAISAQLKVNRDGLREKKTQLESAYYCLSGQKMSDKASRDDCSPEFLNKATTGAYIPGESRFLKNASQSSANELYQCQQRLIDIHAERDKVAAIGSEGIRTLVITGASFYTGGATSAAAFARLGEFGSLLRGALSAGATGIQVGSAATSVVNAYNSCAGDKPTADLSLANNRALDVEANKCPSQANSASQGVRLANQCFLDGMFALTDSLSAGLTANNLRKAVKGSNATTAVLAEKSSSSAANSAAKEAGEVAESSTPNGTASARTAERRHSATEHLPGETSKHHRSPTREKVVAEYGNKKVSIENNQAFVDAAADAKPGGKYRVLDVQNTAMKFLNDATLDKDLVTSMTNKMLDLTEAKMTDLMKKYPNVNVVVKKANTLLPENLDVFVKAHPNLKAELDGPLTDVKFLRMMEKYPDMKADIDALYKDFKGMRYIFTPKPPLTTYPRTWEKDLDSALQEVNSDFAKWVQENKLVRESEDANKWFRFGYGETPDQANLATRYARNQEENRLYKFGERKVQKTLRETLSNAEESRTSLQKELGQTALWDTSGNGKTLKAEVFALARKSDSPEALQAQIASSLEVEISPAQAKVIMSYSRMIDEFSPGINVINRQDASLSSAVHGGISVDFVGMGGDNLKATADALAGNQGKINQAIEKARKGEATVTDVLNQKKDAIRLVALKVSKENNIAIEVRDSGDDLVLIPDKPFTKQVRDQIANELAKTLPPTSIRMSAIPAGVPVDTRSTLGTIGESIEKQLRRNLQGVIPKSELDQMLFRVDMHLPEGQTTTATLNISTSGMNISPQKKELIDRMFNEAVKAKTPASKTSLPPHSRYLRKPMSELAA